MSTPEHRNNAPPKHLPTPDEWEEVMRLAWRPAWSIRSRRGCLRPLADWWRQNRARARAAAQR